MRRNTWTELTLERLMRETAILFFTQPPNVHEYEVMMWRVCHYGVLSIAVIHELKQKEHFVNGVRPFSIHVLGEWNYGET
jgi:hypothetical protein